MFRVGLPLCSWEKERPWLTGFGRSYNPWPPKPQQWSVSTNQDPEAPSQWHYRLARSIHKGRFSHEDHDVISHAFLFQVFLRDQWKEAIHGYFQEIMTTVSGVSNGKVGFTQTLLGLHSVRRTLCFTLIFWIVKCNSKKVKTLGNWTIFISCSCFCFLFLKCR